MSANDEKFTLPTGSVYSNWGEWAALVIGAIDSELGWLPRWLESDRPDVPANLEELRYVLPLLSACVAALEITVMKAFAVRHKETQNTSGGGTSANAYTQHPLNDELFDPDSLVSLSGGNAVVNAGTWLFIGVCAIYKGSNIHAAIYDVSTSARVAEGISDYNSPGDSVGKQALVFHAVTFTGTKELRLEAFSQDAQAGNGLGVPNNKAVETYAYLIGLQLAP